MEPLCTKPIPVALKARKVWTCLQWFIRAINEFLAPDQLQWNQEPSKIITNIKDRVMEEIQNALRTYFKEWQNWLKTAKGFNFAALKPMHAGWKVPDEPALAQKFTELLPALHSGHLGTVDSRKIALLVPSEPVEGVPVLQVMQLRPGSKDSLGLDHVAFYCDNVDGLKAALQNNPEKWKEQSNSPDHMWISMWWGPNKREVKFFDHTSLDLAARDLSETSAEIKAL